eukprot:7797788-Karenia_brevis.AAC.1
MTPEIKHRSGVMLGTVSKLKPRFFNNSWVSVDTKSHVMTSVILCRGLYNAGTWPDLTRGEHACLHSGVMRVYRTVNKDPYLVNRIESDESVVNRNSFLMPINLVRLARLRLMVRIVQHASLHLCALLAVAASNSRSWVYALRKDLHWLSTNVDKFS